MSSAAAGPQARNSILGSLKDVLAAAGRDNTVPGAAIAPLAASVPPLPDMAAQVAEALAAANEPMAPAVSPSAADAAREVKGAPKPLDHALAEADRPPTTRVFRSPSREASMPDASARTSLVRGKQQVKRGGFEADPVVGWLVVVGGPGIGQYRPIFEGNNTVGRSAQNRIAIDFGDDAISGEEQAYIRYDSSDRSFLFVPNLAKMNVVSLNDKRPTAAVELQAMDVITMGRTQLVFVPFCGADFDWSALADG
ncbi:MAG: FHA domain-containing protein [Hyphomicrobium sp.]|nr:FHA domain-containing protein [Hyphomicrobium sp.]